MSNRVDLFSNISATGNGAAQAWPGGSGAFIAEGTIGGSAIKLQMQTPQGTWIDIDPALNFTTLPNSYGFIIPPGQIRAVLTGGTPTNIYAWAASL